MNSKDNLQIYKDFLGFSFKEESSKLQWFHHAGPWFFHRMYEIFGKNLQKNSYPFGNECLAFELCTQNISLQDGWFILKRDGKNPALGTVISFYPGSTYPCSEGSEAFPIMEVHIGYQYNYKHNGSGFAYSLKQVLEEDITPIFSFHGLKFEGWVGRNTNFKYELFITEEILNKILISLSIYMTNKFDNLERIKSLREWAQEELLLREAQSLT